MTNPRPRSVEEYASVLRDYLTCFQTDKKSSDKDTRPPINPA